VSADSIDAAMFPFGFHFNLRLHREGVHDGDHCESYLRERAQRLPVLSV
jgi:hypothetical protein